MRILFLRRFMNSLGPSSRENWPEDNSSWNDEQAKTPTSVYRVRINPGGPDQRKRNGE